MAGSGNFGVWSRYGLSGQRTFQPCSDTIGRECFRLCLTRARSTADGSRHACGERILMRALDRERYFTRVKVGRASNDGDSDYPEEGCLNNNKRTKKMILKLCVAGRRDSCSS